MATKTKKAVNKNSFFRRAGRDLKKNKYVYILFIPVLIYLIVFCYKPLYGVIIAFKNFRPTAGIMGSPWVGFKHFENFFGDFYFGRLIKNTFLISLYSILWGFPVPIIFALLLNEVRNTKFKKTIQTCSYLPHFISMVVVCSMIKLFCMTDGMFNNIIVALGGEASPLLQMPENFRTIYVASGVWQEFGWGSIIYLASLAGIDQELYEAAEIDGAGRLAQTWHITIPGIAPTIIMLLILRMGSIISVGSEKILLLYNEATYKTADVISTYNYRKGLLEGSYSYASAVGLFNSVINVIFLVATNTISKKVTDIGLF